MIGGFIGLSVRLDPRASPGGRGAAQRDPEMTFLERTIMMHTLDRRLFLRRLAGTTAALGLASTGLAESDGEATQLYDISLAQWSLNRHFFAFLGRNRDGSGQPLDPQDFAVIARRDFDIPAVEYVNQFYTEAVRTPGYLVELKKRADGEGVRNVLIMCDGEGQLGDPDTKRRNTAVRNHLKWLEWAQALGCHSIRVNAASDPRLGYHEQMKLAGDGLRTLSELGDTYDLNVIVENHGGLSSHGRWLVGVMELVDHPRCGTLPDFGNFRNVIGSQRRGDGAPGGGAGPVDYNPYLGVYELMPFAKGVSAKSYAFDDQGNETTIDYARMMRIVCDPRFDFSGYVGIEFEGPGDPMHGIRQTKRLLERIRDTLA
jgi:hypothetical protein